MRPLMRLGGVCGGRVGDDRAPLTAGRASAASLETSRESCYSGSGWDVPEWSLVLLRSAVQQESSEGLALGAVEAEGFGDPAERRVRDTAAESPRLEVGEMAERVFRVEFLLQ